MNDYELFEWISGFCDERVNEEIAKLTGWAPHDYCSAEYTVKFLEEFAHKGCIVNIGNIGSDYDWDVEVENFDMYGEDGMYVGFKGEKLGSVVARCYLYMLVWNE